MNAWEKIWNKILSRMELYNQLDLHFFRLNKIYLIKSVYNARTKRDD